MTNVLANLATGSLIVTPLINSAHLTGWWHIKGKSQSLGRKTCWLTTVLAHTGKATRTEMSTDNQPKHTHTHTLFLTGTTQGSQESPPPHTQAQNSVCVITDTFLFVYSFIHSFICGPSVCPLPCSVLGYEDEENRCGPCPHRLVHRHMSPWPLSVPDYLALRRQAKSEWE